jgi:hypothetical protein
MLASAGRDKNIIIYNLSKLINNLNSSFDAIMLNLSSAH